MNGDGPFGRLPGAPPAPPAERGVLDEIRRRSREVAERSEHVRIDDVAMEQLVARLETEPTSQPYPGAYFRGDDDATVAYVLVLETLNFGSGWFPHLRKRAGASGHLTVAAALTDLAMAGDLWDAAALQAVRPAECARVFGQPTSGPAFDLMALFATALRDLGRYLATSFGGSPSSLVRSAGGSAEQLVVVLDQMPFFRDVGHLDGVDVPFYKRAQICSATLASALDGQGDGAFHDLDRLTMFADNLVPHVLWCEGVLWFDPALVQRIERGEVLAAGGGEEIELRANAITAVEDLVAGLRARGVPTNAMGVDHGLWHRGQRPRVQGPPTAPHPNHGLLKRREFRTGECPKYTRRTVKSTVEPLEGNKVKLSVEVDEAEFDKAVNAAFKKIAREVRVPGFRPGKAPRKVLEARLGKNIGRGQALEDAIPTYYVEAVKEHEVDVIAAPEIDITGGEEDGAIQFDAVVEIRPDITVPGYQNLRVTVESPLPTDAEIDEQLETLRGRFAELESADRPAVDDDVVTIDIAGSQGGEELAGLTADDFAYEVGTSGIVPEVDDNLRGAKVGDILQFEVSPPGADDDDDAPPPIEFKILVKDVKAKVLPPLDDKFADEASEFETLAELRDDLLTRMTAVKKMRAAGDLSEKVGAALADLVEEDIPEALIDNELRQKVQELAMRLSAQGIDFEQWLQMTQQTQEDIVGELRKPAEQSARVDLALRAIAEAQELDCTDEELEAEYESVAERIGVKPAEVRRRFERAGEVQAVRSDVKKRKAFEWLLERVEIVDPDGKPLDRSAFEPDETAELDADAPVADDATGADEDEEEVTE